MQDAGPVCAFPGSVFGARYPAPGVDRVPGPRCQVPDTWYPVPGTRGIGLGLPGGLSCILHLVSCIHSSTEHYGKSVASVALRAYRTP
jgi:hypothetical protein